jgi:predicted RNase H-like HicB family nuclease
MGQVVFNVKLPITIKKKARVYISRCPILDIYSQGNSETEAKKNLIEAVKLFLITCFEKGTFLFFIVKEVHIEHMSKMVLSVLL